MNKGAINKKFLLVAFLMSVWVAVFICIFRAVTQSVHVELERWPATLCASLLTLMGETKQSRIQALVSSMAGTALACAFVLLRNALGPMIGFDGVMCVLVVLIMATIVLTRLFPRYLCSVVFIFFSLSFTYAQADIVGQTALRLLTIAVGFLIYLPVRRFIRSLPSHMSKKEEAQLITQ